MSTNPLAIEVNNISKSYGTIMALDNVSLSVKRGEIFGLIGLVQLSAQTRFKQRLEWSGDSNVLEYKVQVKDSAGKIIKTVTTEDNFLELTLSPGTYSTL